MASSCADQASIAEPTKLTLRCFLNSFNEISNDPAHFGDLPACNKPTDGSGILINLTGKERWQLFATWMIKLLSKCLTEGTLYVEGLINVSFVMAACSLLCFVDADLHMVGCHYFMLEFSILINSKKLVHSDFYLYFFPLPGLSS